ncbi:MAG: apolipoprotein N-acyltransferase, partial [Deltaproteobacteria bacterium]|nr:apolipoprotein N-acyltransferase [Deltaproteobacteria bacterium]
AGFLFAASQPPLDLHWAAWLALTPLLWALAGDAAGGARRAAGLGACFAATTVLAVTPWLPVALVDGFGAGALAAGVVWLAAAVSALPAAAVFAVWVSRVAPGSPLYVPVVGAGWGLVELSWASAFPQLPWVALAAGQLDSPLTPLAAGLGVHGCSAWLAAFSALVVQASLRQGRRTAWLAAAGLLLLAVTGALTGSVPDARARSVRVALVQPGLPMSQRPRADFATRNLDTLIELSRASGPADLWVWPESAFLADPRGRAEWAGPVQALVDERGTPLLAGGRVRTGAGWRTVAMLFAPGAPPHLAYAKRRLVPLAEAVPSWLPARVRRGLGGLVPSLPVEAGAEAGALEIGDWRVDVSICFEAIFQRPAVRADLLVNLVNDGWYDAGAGARQHLALARWRAVEAGAPMLRAASTGISAFVSADGTVAARLDVGDSAVLVADVSPVERTTPFERLGNVPLLLLGAGLFAALAVVRGCRSG